MMRWFSIGVIAYMILGILWWGMLLFSKNEDLYNLQLEYATSKEAIEDIRKEWSKQKLMIIGEGIVLGLSLLAGIFIINRSAQREIKSAKQQSNFLLSVSHELKSPIAAIKLALETLNRPNLPEDAAKKITSSAVKDANRLEKLVQNILLSASIEEDRLELYKEESDIAQLLVKTSKRYNHTSKHDNKIITKGTDDATLITIDTYNFTQALSNIIDNAIKYAEKSTPITIILSKQQDSVTIDIQNQGTPIDVKEQSKIFDKFYRGQNKVIRKKEGTGIGLYISNEIIRAHDGFITTQNKGDNIVEFTIKLPL